jgi:Mn-dependent DtxR family transcriptional regulator
MFLSNGEARMVSSSNSDSNKASKVKIKITRLESIRDANSSKKEQDLSPRMEDYLEVIYELIQQKGYAPTVEISEYLNVKSPSVTKMMQRLYESGYINYERYKGVSLTGTGISIAESIHNKHGLLAEFFKLIGIDEETANKDAEEIEHHLHKESIEKLEKFVAILKKELGTSSNSSNNNNNNSRGGSHNAI